jgi:hypothetical protein
MVEEWSAIVAGVLSPARPQLERCLRAYRQYSDALADRLQARTRSLADVERRLNAARERVFAAGTGVVPAEMTVIEREWLAAARAPAPSRELETLWRQVAPKRWIEAGRPAPTSAEAIVTLASDPDGVEEAERAASTLRDALAPSGVTIDSKGESVAPYAVEWMVSREIVFAVRAEHLFSAAFAPMAGAPHETLQRAHRLRDDVRAQLGDRKFVTRNSSLGRELGWLAFASSVWREMSAEPAPFEPFLTIYRLGYVPTAVDSSGVTLTADPAIP